MLMIDMVLLFPAQAFLILGIQTLELSIVLLLLKCPGKPQYDLPDFFHANKSSKRRSWLLTSVLGFGFLLSLVFITSYFADRFMGHKVNLFTFKLLMKYTNALKMNINNSSIEIPIQFSHDIINHKIQVMDFYFR